ncbi:MAG: hypothetical protein U0794_10150 [Isosphaeraceae bacterium]
MTHDEAGVPYDWSALLGDLCRIHVAWFKPRNAYLAVPYRGYWYYIDDADLETKSTIGLLQELSTFRSAAAPARPRHPC